jgi:hypothetical protein
MNAVTEERIALREQIAVKCEVALVSNPRAAIANLQNNSDFEIAVLKVVCGGEIDAAQKVLSFMTTSRVSIPVILMTPGDFIAPADKLQRRFPKLVMSIVTCELDPSAILSKIRRAHKEWSRKGLFRPKKIPA